MPDQLLDRDHGPLILELNARPGLSIQIANGTGITKRLDYIESIYRKRKNHSERVAHVQKVFAEGGKF